ncbi:MAG: relaxase/mobilization nuclease domain-containing protein [Actinomycetaceae bacterium]|nr:relaxase/mobilization nuclease domain-containing protein [Actinomycetaceae bacterium]
MIPNIVDGGDMGGLMRYLVGPGRANEHTEPHLVAGSRTIMNRWGDWNELSVAQASEIANYLDSFMQETESYPTGPIRKFDPETGKTRAVDYGPNHVWHCSVSLSPDEGPLSEDKWAAIASDFMDQMEFTSASGKAECRWVAIHHGVSKNGGDHIHIAANIIREDGTRWNFWNDQPRSQRACNMLEHKYGLRILESREHARGSKCDSAQALNAAKRAGKPVTDRAALETRLRAASKAAGNEVEFIRNARSMGVRLRPRFAKGRTDVVVGYSAALHTKPGVKTQWYAGGSIARDLTLSALRERWPDTIEHSSEAVSAWQDAWKGMPLRPQRRSYTTQEWQGHKRAFETYREHLCGVDPSDPLALANATNDVAGLLAAAAQQRDLSEDERRALDFAARQVGRNAQLKHRPAKHTGASPWVVLGAQLLSTAVMPKNSEVSYALMLVATLELVKALADLYVQAQQANTARAMLRDTRAVYDYLHADGAPVPHDFNELQLNAPLQQDALPESVATPSEPLTVDEIVEPSLAHASAQVDTKGADDFNQQLRKQYPWLVMPEDFTGRTSANGDQSRQSRPHLPDMPPPSTKKKRKGSHPLPPPFDPFGRGQGRGR